MSDCARLDCAEPLSRARRPCARICTNKQIANELVVALETAKKHVSHILGKLGAANRTQAVARARELGLLR